MMPDNNNLPSSTSTDTAPINSSCVLLLVRLVQGPNHPLNKGPPTLSQPLKFFFKRQATTSDLF